MTATGHFLGGRCSANSQKKKKWFVVYMFQNLETAGPEFFFAVLFLLEAQNVSQGASDSVVRSTTSGKIHSAGPVSLSTGGFVIYCACLWKDSQLSERCFLCKNIQQKKRKTRACDVRTVAVSVVVLSVALGAKSFETKDCPWQLPEPLQISEVKTSLNVVTFYSFG